MIKRGCYSINRGAKEKWSFFDEFSKSVVRTKLKELLWYNYVSEFFVLCAVSAGAICWCNEEYIKHQLTLRGSLEELSIKN